MGNKIQNIYVGQDLVRPIKNAIIDFLLIGGGGGGGGSSRYYAGCGGNAGCVVNCSCYCMVGSCCIIIGSGSCGAQYDAGNACASCYGDIVANGGAGGCRPSGSCHGHGGVGAGGCYSGQTGGIGIQSDISGACCCYAGGGGGGNGGAGKYGGGNAGGYRVTGCPATTYGSGGGAGGYGCRDGGAGCQGVFMARYPTACGYNITGGTKYTCGDYTIHCFTSDGTLTVS